MAKQLTGEGQAQGMTGSSVWFPVMSSNVRAVRRLGGSLLVKFKGYKGKPDSVYIYYGAGGELEAMRGSDSPGRFVYYSLRRNYSYSRY